MHARPLSRFEAFAQGVNTKHANAVGRGLTGKSPGGEVDAPAFEVSDVFNYQSYFSDTLLQNAILEQPSNEPIVPSTLKESQVSGYAIGLHPSSETPVAVRLQTGAQQGASQTYRLKPGDVVRAQGSKDGKPASFGGFEYGLPFGWLGGGSAMLIVMRTPDSDVFWTGNPEIIFHRTRLQIYAAGSAPLAADVRLNWPKRFPWPNAEFGANNIKQSGLPAIGVSPTRTAFRLRMTSLANPADMRAVFYGSNDFGWSSAGTATLTDTVFVDFTWGSYTQVGVAAPPGPYYPSQITTGQLERFACDNGSVSLIDITGAATLEGQFVDVVRYGTL